jgi:hypothetical protein
MLTLKLDVEEWNREDYTASTGNGISFTVYTEEKMVNAKNLTGYTLKLRFYDQDNVEITNFDASILVAASGTGEFLPAIGELNFNYIGEVELEMTGTNEIISAIGNNGSAKLRVR